MKICFVGSSGHGQTVFSAKKWRNNLDVVGYCRSWEDEQIESLVKGFNKRNINVKEYSGYDTMIEQCKPDILVIDSMFCDHEKIARYALEKNIHVYCDKPLMTHIEDYDKLKEVANNSEGILWAMMTQRYEDSFYTAKQLIQEGSIGKIKMINGQKSYKLGQRPDFYKKRKTYGGTIPWVAIHSIDLILWITKARCEEIYAKHDALDNRNHGELETMALIHMKLQGNILAHVNADYYRPENGPSHGDDRLRIVGTKGIIEVRDGKVYILNEENEGIKPVHLRKSPQIFEDFLCGMKSEEHTLLSTKASLYSTYVSLKARESADTNKEIKLMI